jgi:hypothetical protein
MIAILSGWPSLPVAVAVFSPDGGQRGRGELFVKGEKEFHALVVAVEFFRAVAEVPARSGSAWA